MFDIFSHMPQNLVQDYVQHFQQGVAMATQIMNVSDARRRLSELLTELVDPIYITVYGKPSAVIVSYDSYESLLARMDDLEDSLDALIRRDEPTVDFEAAVREMDAVSAQP